MINVITNQFDTTLTLRVVGHAGQSEKGSDIICASVSILVYAVAECVERMYEKDKLKGAPEVDLKEGNAEIVMNVKSKHFNEALHKFEVAIAGFELLSENYPDYITTFNSLKKA